MFFFTFFIFQCHFEAGTQFLALNCPATAMQEVLVGNPSTVSVNLRLPDGTITGGIQPYFTFYNPNVIPVGQTTRVTLSVADSSNPQQMQQCAIQVTVNGKYFQFSLWM